MKMSWQRAVVEFEKQRSNRKNWYSESLCSHVSMYVAGTMCLDVRQESCFTEYRHGGGVTVLEGLYPRSLCCCSTVGKAWGGPSDGSRCEQCPRQSSDHHQELCPKVGTLTVYWHDIYFKEYHHGGGVTVSLSPYTWKIKNFEHYCCC